MKTLFLLIAAIFISSISYAQYDPVKWKYSAKKIKDKTYELTFTAEVEKPWHIYSLTTPDGGPLPTKFSFSKNPPLNYEGKVKEAGKINTKFEEVFGINVKYFDGKAVFTQIVKVKSKARTVAKGVLEYMACNDEQCLPPTEVEFSLVLE